MKKVVLYVSNPKIAIVVITPSVTTQIHLCHLKGTKLSDAALFSRGVQFLWYTSVLEAQPFKKLLNTYLVQFEIGLIWCPRRELNPQP